MRGTKETKPIQGGTKQSRAFTNVFVRETGDEPSIFSELNSIVTKHRSTKSKAPKVTMQIRLNGNGKHKAMTSAATGIVAND